MSDSRTADETESVDRIIKSYIEARENGERPDEQDILNRHPEYKTILTSFFRNYKWVETVEAEPEQTPNLGEDFENIEPVGDEGGQGIVYKARQKSLRKIVAIKVPRMLMARVDPESIRREAQRVSNLRHPNIVSVHQFGEHEGLPFFVMDFIEGQSLAKPIKSQPLPPAEAVRYTKTITEAILYAHQRELLHCDLKPANILRDHDGKLYVADFGLARLLTEAGRDRSNGPVGGTPKYMAPEQASGGDLTTATDIYGIGATLYALLTGKAPFDGDTRDEILRAVRETPPVPPSKHASGIDQELEAICLKCLAKDPDERYRSAYGLIRDLERYQNGQETTARKWNRRERFTAWCGRNPGPAGLTAAIAAVSILIVAMAVSIADERKVRQLEQAHQSDVFAARDLAKAALLQLRDWAHVVEIAATNPKVSELITKGDRHALQLYVEQVCRDAPDFAASCSIRGSDGYLAARVGGGFDPTIPSKDRDYFQGARAHRVFAGRNVVHISKAYQGVLDNLFKFAVSAPVVDRNQEFIGQLDISATTDAVLGLIKFDDPHRTAALIAPRDPHGPEKYIDPAVRHVVLFHPAYHHGVNAIPFLAESAITPYSEAIHAKELDDSTLTLSPVGDYVDPVASSFPKYEGRWIAALAPIGNTGFFVVVQQRFEDAIQVDPFVSWNMAAGIAITVCILIAVAVAVLRRSSRGSIAA